jgi:hypothetical protein
MTTPTKKQLVVVEPSRAGWLARDWQGRPLCERPTKLGALEIGLRMAVEQAGRACLDLSLFDMSFSQITK